MSDQGKMSPPVLNLKGINTLKRKWQTSRRIPIKISNYPHIVHIEDS